MEVDEPGVVVISSSNREVIKLVEQPGDFERIPYESASCKVLISDVTFRDSTGECTPDEHSRYFTPDFDGELEIGQADYYIDIDFEQALQSMSCGEISYLKFTYKNNTDILQKCINCKVRLMEVSNEELISDWPWERLYGTSLQHKDTGVELVKEKRMTDAFRKFSKALKFLIAIEPIDPNEVLEETVHEMIALKVKLYNNLAHCQLHYDEYEAALTLCNKALEFDPDNVKALYRRCVSYMGQELWELAYADIDKVLKLDPNDKAAQQKANILKPKINKINSEYTAVIKKMFG